MSQKQLKPRPRRRVAPGRGRPDSSPTSLRGLEPAPQRTENPSPEDRLVDSFSLFVRWSRRELHHRSNELAGVQIEQSAAVILGALYLHEPVRMSDLAEHLELDRSTVSRQVAEAVAQGLVARVEDPADARATMLTLTPDGRALRRKLANAFAKICSDLMSDWNREDQLAFARLMDKLADRFRGDGVY